MNTIGDNLAFLEKAQEIDLNLLSIGDQLRVQTQNTLYTLTKLDGKNRWSIQGHPIYCPVSTNCRVVGCTFGGSMIKLNSIFVGGYLEFVIGDRKRLLTSAIQHFWRLR